MTGRARSPSHLRNRGLTRVDAVLLIALAIVLSALIIPPLLHGHVGPNRGRDCQNSLKQIGIYFNLYKGKFGTYPPFGAGNGTWFSSLWRADMATDGNLWRCATVGKSGTGTHFWGIVRGGNWASTRPEFGGKPFTFAAPADLARAPGDLPIACDQMGSPANHGDGDVNVLFLDGHVQNFPKDSPFLKGPPGFLGATGWDAPAGTK